MDYKKAYKEALERAQQGKPIDEVFPELAESNNEKIRKALLEHIKGITSWGYFLGISREQMIAWLEKQGEKLPVGFYYVNSEGKKFYSDTFKYGDVILHVEKQGEQKTTDKVEPKFKVGDCIRHKGSDESYKIVTTDDNYYFCENNHAFAITSQDYFELVDQKPAKWSAEDEANMDAVWKACGTVYGIAYQSILGDWLKSLKDRLKGEQQ